MDVGEIITQFNLLITLFLHDLNSLGARGLAKLPLHFCDSFFSVYCFLWNVFFNLKWMHLSKANEQSPLVHHCPVCLPTIPQLNHFMSHIWNYHRIPMELLLFKCICCHRRFWKISNIYITISHIVFSTALLNSVPWPDSCWFMLYNAWLSLAGLRFSVHKNRGC